VNCFFPMTSFYLAQSQRSPCSLCISISVPLYTLEHLILVFSALHYYILYYTMYTKCWASQKNVYLAARKLAQFIIQKHSSKEIMTYKNGKYLKLMSRVWQNMYAIYAHVAWPCEEEEEKNTSSKRTCWFSTFPCLA
jgi:hypothetical protein